MRQSVLFCQAFSLSVVRLKRSGKPGELPDYKQVYLPYDTPPTKMELDRERRKFSKAYYGRQEDKKMVEVKDVPQNMYTYGKEGMSIPISIFKEQNDPVIGPEWTYPGIYENKIVAQHWYLEELFDREKKNEFESPWQRQVLDNQVKKRMGRVAWRMTMLNIKAVDLFQKEEEVLNEWVALEKGKIMRGIFICLLFVLLILPYRTVSAGNLYPSCGGAEFGKKIEQGKTETILTYRKKLKAFSLSCLAFEVTSEIGRDGVDHCLIKHQTEYAYRLALKTVYYNEEGDPVNRYYDVKNFVGGSIGSTRTYLPKPAELSLVLTNLAESSKCVLKIRALITIDSEDTIENGHTLPSLVASDPPTVYANRQGKTSLVFRFPNSEAALNSSRDIVTLIRFEEKCEDSSTIPLRYLDYQAGVPRDVSLTEDTKLYSSRSIVFDETDVGEFRLCYRLSYSDVAHELGTLAVFGGNPSYWEFISGPNERGQIFVGVPCEIKFYGYNLDTRPGGDTAKLVIESEDCDDGKPAGGVPQATDLGPADDYGPNTTFTTWSYTVRIPGAFKMCYLRASGGLWTEVPYIGDIGPSGTTTSTPTPVTPTEPASKKDCPTVPVKKPFKSARFVLKGTNSFPSEFLTTVSELLCVPKNAVTFTYIHVEGKDLLVYLNLYCDGVSCDTVERLNYVEYLGNKEQEILKKVGISSAKAFTSVIAFEGGTGKSSSVASTLLWCITFLILGTIAIYAILKYKRQQEYTANFGLDDGELDDMYALNPVSHNANSEVIRNAVIEIED